MVMPASAAHAPTASAQADGGKRQGRSVSARSLVGLDVLNFLLADVQTGVGPFLAIYLAGHGWDPQRVGYALTAGSIAGILAQTPAGALVDRLRSKRALIAIGLVALAAGALLIAVRPRLGPILLAQALIGATSSVFIPAVIAISLGLVGHKLLDRRQGRNQAFNSAGNVFAAVTMGLLAYYTSDRAIFFLVIALALPAILSLRLIDPSEIDYELARGARDGHDAERVRIWDLTKNRALVMFLVASVLFHFANAAMLPLLGELLAHGKGRSSALFMSACVVTTQATIALIATSIGRLSERHGRKRLLLLGFGVLPLRGVLYTLTDNTYALIAIQMLDGIGAGIFGIVSVLVIADLTRGSGRFNLAQGAVATAIGIGAALSQTAAGWAVHHFGYHAGFLALSGIAALALALLWLAVPETKGSEFTDEVPRVDGPSEGRASPGLRR